jgi:hypothetical protein
MAISAYPPVPRSGVPQRELWGSPFAVPRVAPSVEARGTAPSTCPPQKPRDGGHRPGAWPTLKRSVNVRERTALLVVWLLRLLTVSASGRITNDRATSLCAGCMSHHLHAL